MSKLKFNENMKDAPKDGTALLLLVAGGENRLVDDHAAIDFVTMGFNSCNDTGIDKWQCMGWNWSHDCVTELNPAEVSGWLNPKWDRMDRTLELR